MKETKLLRKVLTLALAIMILFNVISPLTVRAADPAWKLSDSTEIFWVNTADSEANYDTLSKQVQLFSSELAEKVTGTALPISYGEEKDADTHDIILVFAKSANLPAQGYSIKSTSTSVKITASDAAGLFYGCRALIKQLLQKSSVTSVTSSPDVLERALSLDNGRKYYSAAWIKQMIRELSWTEMNALVLHFSEEMGIGIESKVFPWLHGRDGTLGTQKANTTDNRVLTQEEVKDIVEYARQYHVEIIPSFDSPGHLNYLVKTYNKHYGVSGLKGIGNYFHYNGSTALVTGTRNTSHSRGIDISNGTALTFIRQVITEYATLFRNLGCTKFDIGGDELLGWGTAVVSTSTATRWKQLDHWKTYAQRRSGKSNAVAYDAFLMYMNDLNKLVRDLGYTSVRMWNDEVLRTHDTGWSSTNGVAKLDKNIDVWYWDDSRYTANTYINNGYELYNITSDYNYYVLSDDYFSSNRTSFTKSTAKLIYTEWNPYVFTGDGKSSFNTTVGNAGVKGSAFGIWSDNPDLKTEAQVMSGVRPLLRAHGAKAWDAKANSTVSWTAFNTNWGKYGNAPAGTTSVPAIYHVVDRTALKEAVAEYASYDATIYSAVTFGAYTAAVNAGEAILNSDKPSQPEVDDAANAIIVARDGLKLDAPELEAIIAASEDVDYTLYTVESFALYAKAIGAAKDLLAVPGYTYEDVEKAIADIENAKNNLELKSTGAVECILSATARTSYAYAGKAFTIVINTDKAAKATGIKVFDDRGNEVVIDRYALNTRQTTRDTHNIIFSVSAADRGERTYTFYAILPDGTLSGDSIQLHLTVR